MISPLPKKVFLTVLGACAMSFLMVGAAIAQGNDFVVGELRVDLSEVYDSKDYRVLLLANDKPNASGGMTVAWLGLDLAQYNGQLYSAQFSQVGLYTDNVGLYWFVYAEPGVTCLRGTTQFGTCMGGRPCGCIGTSSDIVSLGTWHWVELVTYGQGYWIARVYDTNTNAYDVALIWSTSPRIYFAQSTTEEAYTVAQDPFLTASFYHWHPQYMQWGTGWQEWPRSRGNIVSNSTIWVSPSSICPSHYGATPNMFGDERSWYAGTGGQTCFWLLFPPIRIYLPLILK